ncbi:MAG: YHYH protein [Actinomycetota bacterium]
MRQPQRPHGVPHESLRDEPDDRLPLQPEEAAAEPQLLGYALDGYPIYTGNDQYTSSWALMDESLFATDTWAAHSYVEGSGDLDECNGLVDDDGDYAYYTTDTFPYVLGCYTGVVDLEAARGGGGGPDGGGPDGGRPQG